MSIESSDMGKLCVPLVKSWWKVNVFDDNELNFRGVYLDIRNADCTICQLFRKPANLVCVRVQQETIL